MDSNINLQQISDSIKAEIKVDKDGKATLSQRGAGRLLGLGKDTLATSKMSVVLLTMLTEYGFNPAENFANGILYVALGLIVNYYVKSPKPISRERMAVKLTETLAEYEFSPGTFGLNH